MLDIKKVKGIIFDYGGTIDSNGKHWAEVIWDAYVANDIPVKKEEFRDAYVYGERYLAINPVITPDFTFRDLLLAKTKIQIKWLIDHGFLTSSNKTSGYSLAVSNQCYNFAISTLQNAKSILKVLSEKYPLVLVSNFYGNIHSVLKDFELDVFFNSVIESAVVGVRKPDPAIFSLGVEALGFYPEEIVVIGDSYSKDIVPANNVNCKTIWLRGIGWEEDLVDSVADIVIQDFVELKTIFKL